MAILYPNGKHVTLGEVQPLFDGIAWLRLPLRAAFSTAHINVWLVRDGSGWAMFDTGLYEERAVDFWAEWKADNQRADISRVFVTHMHPDHIGMAGWLTEHFGCSLSMTRAEYDGCCERLSTVGETAPTTHKHFFSLAGWSGQDIRQYEALAGKIYDDVYQLPNSYQKLEDGDTIEIGDRSWKVIIGTGHSPEHACFYSESHHALISGDQVLPTISSNVSVHPATPEADPLSGWLESLSRLKSAVPDDVTVLPAHGAPFVGLHERLDQLASKREEALHRLRERLVVPCRVIDVLDALFRSPPAPVEIRWLMLATGSALAYLRYLEVRGEVRVQVISGASWYKLI